MKKTFRLIVERSCMANNDEWVRFTTSEKDLSSKTERDALNKEIYEGSSGAFDRATLQVCRPVFQEEIQAGLNIDYRGSAWDEKPPKITEFIDGFYKLAKSYEFSKEYMNMVREDGSFDLGKWVAYYAGTHFYDCMSAGCNPLTLSVLRHLAEQPGINLDEYVYPSMGGPGDKDHETLQDFLDECESGSIPKYEELVAELGLVRALPLKETFLTG
jgi:hypothetical protein